MSFKHWEKMGVTFQTEVHANYLINIDLSGTDTQDCLYTRKGIANHILYSPLCSSMNVMP